MKMKKPMIGLMPLVDEGKESYWMLPGYMKGIEKRGGIPVMLPLTNDEAALKQMADTFDGFLFTGGHDISPKLYGESTLPVCDTRCEARDQMEQILFREILSADKPVLGICRGLQLINALLGGTLYQDLPTQYPTQICHRQKAPYDVPAHSVDICKDTPLHTLLRMDQILVNSCHHQAVKTLSGRAKAMAISEDGLTEALYVPDRAFVWGVQWHPEFALKDEVSRKIFDAFVQAAGRQCGYDSK